MKNKSKKIKGYAFLIRGKIQTCECHIALRPMFMIMEREKDAQHLGYIHNGKFPPEIKEVEIRILPRTKKVKTNK